MVASGQPVGHPGRSRKTRFRKYIVTFTSRAYGMTIRSDIPLLGPQPTDEGGADVTMCEGPVPDAIENVETETLHWAASAEELLLHVPRVGRFHVRGGCEVRYAPVAGIASEMVQSYLLGSCLGAVLHQRGRQVLHGSVVAQHGAAFAICGKSGTGKSTSAAWLVEHGARMMSDDLAVFSDVAPPQVVSGYPQAKLTGAALAGLGRETAELRKLPDDRDKYALPRAADFLDGEAPLRGIFVLERSNRAEPAVMRLEGGQAIAALVKHTYRRHYVVGSHAARHYQAWAGIADRIPLVMIARPRASDSTQFVVSAISRAMSETIAEGPEQTA